MSAVSCRTRDSTLRAPGGGPCGLLPPSTPGLLRAIHTSELSKGSRGTHRTELLGRDAAATSGPSGRWAPTACCRPQIKRGAWAYRLALREAARVIPSQPTRVPRAVQGTLLFDVLSSLGVEAGRFAAFDLGLATCPATREPEHARALDRRAGRGRASCHRPRLTMTVKSRGCPGVRKRSTGALFASAGGDPPSGPFAFGAYTPKFTYRRLKRFAT